MINGHDLIDYLRRKKRFFEKHGTGKMRLRVYDEIIAYVLQMIHSAENAENELFFDVEERHENCTVQILKNSVTGAESVGWWENG